jgi:hypothetical protein
VTDITWTDWTATSATGVGTLHINTCNPDCAAGNIDTYPSSTVVLSNPGFYKGFLVFQDVIVTPPDGQGPPQASTSPGAWGWA